MARGGARPNPIPTTPEQLAETLRTEAQGRTLTGERLDQIVRGYVAASDPGGDINAQIREQAETVLQQWLRGQGGAHAPIGLAMAPGAAQSARSALYSTTAPGVAADGIFDTVGELFAGVHPKANQYDADLQAKLGRLKNATSSTVPSEGGFLIPETMRSDLLMMSLETSIVRPKATVVPMSSLRVPVPAVDDTSHVNSVFGGVVGFWTEEGAALVESSGSFGRVVLDAKKLTAYVEAPNELVADAPAFGAFINRALPQAISFYEDKAFLGGSGVGEPLGVLNGPGVITVTRAAVDVIDFPDVVNMFSRMLPASLSRAVWVASIDTLPQLLTLHAEPVAGQPVSPLVWMNNGSVAGAPPMTLFGRPIVFSENVPKLTEPGALSFVDFAYYLIGDRQAMELRASEHLRFNVDKTAYRIIERCDGRPWISNPLTPANQSATISPYVTIAT
jgi:HK97 family phage major capsid protein